MAHQWAIEIFDTNGGGVAFRPFVPGAEIGDPLHAETGDTVLWSNRTDRDLTLESMDDPTLDQTVEAGRSSDFLFVVSDPPRVRYRCVQPLQEHVIEIS